MDRADARSSMLRLIAKRNGNCVALNWLYEQNIADSCLLTDVGWTNAAVMLTEEDRWDDAIALVESLPEETVGSFPEILFLKGILYACLLFPTPLRHRLLQHQPLDFGSHTHEGDAALHGKKMSLRMFARAKLNSNKSVQKGEPKAASTTCRGFAWY